MKNQIRRQVCSLSPVISVRPSGTYKEVVDAQVRFDRTVLS